MNSRNSSKGNGSQRSDNARTKGTQQREVLEATELTVAASRGGSSLRGRGGCRGLGSMCRIVRRLVDTGRLDVAREGVVARQRQISTLETQINVRSAVQGDGVCVRTW